MSTLTVYSDYACPWCYLGNARIRRVLAAARARGESDFDAIEIVHFPLSPDTPKEGRDTLTYLRARGIPAEAATQRLAEMCQAEGLPYSTQLEGKRIWNTQRAQELALWAAEQLSPDALESLHASLFAAYHVDNRNLYDVEVLAEIASEVGLDADEARGIFDPDRYAALRREHWDRAMGIGVRGVPTFVRGRQALVGAQPAEVMAEFVKS